MAIKKKRIIVCPFCGEFNNEEDDCIHRLECSENPVVKDFDKKERKSNLILVDFKKKKKKKRII
jgi:hypothetical protein